MDCERGPCGPTRGHRCAPGPACAWAAAGRRVCVHGAGACVCVCVRVCVWVCGYVRKAAAGRHACVHGAGACVRAWQQQDVMLACMVHAWQHQDAVFVCMVHACARVCMCVHAWQQQDTVHACMVQVLAWCKCMHGFRHACRRRWLVDWCSQSIHALDLRPSGPAGLCIGLRPGSQLLLHPANKWPQPC